MTSSSSSRKRVSSKKDLQKEIARRQDKGAKSKSSPKAPLGVETPAPPVVRGPEVMDPWTPGSYIALKALISARLCSAIWGLINDCDETFNYWEPTHYLLYGKGLQTWEYSPIYALRSYTYLLVHAGPAFLYAKLLQSNRTLVFFFIRCMLAILASASELYFYRGVCKEFGVNIGRIALGITVFSAGMFIASTAYLPSSFAMYFTMVSYGAWFHNSPHLAIFTTALSAFLGWPFAGLIGVPIAYDFVIRKNRSLLFLKWCFISTFTIVVPMFQIDSNFFGRLVFPPLHLVFYNMFSPNGPDLYGTSPPSFYLLNGLLNFNILFPAAILSLPLYMMCSLSSSLPPRQRSLLPVWLPLSSLYAWLLVFLTQPHKEERFLFPIYPLICLGAALSIDTVQKICFGLFVREKRQHYLRHTNWVAVAILVLSSGLSISRIVGQYQGYSAPFESFLELHRLDHEGKVRNLRTVNVCLGREWHRFPSSFFLPAFNWEVKFIESSFKGQLPQPFSTHVNGTLLVPANMNDENREERSRYIQPSSCHFLIDTDREEETELEPRYSARKNQWTVIHSVPFLDADRSPRLLRAFYIPFLTKKYCHYVDFVILQSTKLNKILPG